jgi:phosphatidylinositol-3-phosphatase
MLGLAGTTVSTALVDRAGAATLKPGTHGVPELSHVVVVFLENESATATFEDPSAAPALATLRKEGSYVPNYFGVGHASLDNYLAAFSGEQPDAATEGDCLGMAPDPSCTYTASVPTLATTLDKAGLSWKVYSEGMDGAPGGHNCLHSPSLSVPDPYQGPGTNGYATRHNPAPWFHSILDQGTGESYCQAHSVDLTQLASDDQSPSTLPRWSFVEPDTCHDGHDNQSGSSGGCALDPEGPSAPSGVAAINAWLPGFVQNLTSSPAWDSRSVLVVTFDEGATADPSGCTACHDTSAGGRIGALFLGAPVRSGFTSTWNGDHYGLLRTVEYSFGLPPLKSLAIDATAAATVHDGDPGVTPVTDIWTAGGPLPAASAPATPAAGSGTTGSAAGGGSAPAGVLPRTGTGESGPVAGGFGASAAVLAVRALRRLRAA